MRTGRVLVALSCAAVATSSNANITFYDVFRVADYWQSSNSQPGAVSGYRGDARIFSDTAGEVTGGVLTKPDSSTAPMTPNGAFQIGFHVNAANLADLESALPDGMYTFELTSGSAAPQTASLNLPPSVYPDTVPFLTGTSYEALQGMDASTGVSLTWNTFSDQGPDVGSYIFFTIFDLTDGSVPFAHFGTTSYNGDAVGGGTLVNGHDYAFSLAFSNRYGIPNAGFNGATSNAGYDWVTSGTFRAVPEPTTLSILIPLGVLALKRRKR